jgi:hypothetical protein
MSENVGASTSRNNFTFYFTVLLLYIVTCQRTARQRLDTRTQQWNNEVMQPGSAQRFGKPTSAQAQ